MQIKIDKIIYSNRRTYSLQVNGDAKLILKVPHHTNHENIQNIINKHRKWIVKKISLAVHRKVKKHEFKNGEKFLLLGNSYNLTFIEDQNKPIIFDNEFKLDKKYSNTARNILIKWYKDRAYKIFLERINYYSEILGLRYNTLKVSLANKRWGSCSNKGNINISWRLVMAPLDIIDYVIIHELVHLKIKNHSKEFWGKIQAIDPGYKLKKKWLKDNEHLLRI